MQTRETTGYLVSATGIRFMERSWGFKDAQIRR